MYRPFPLGKEAVSAEIFWRPYTATKVSVEAGLTANYGGWHGPCHADSLDNRPNAPPCAHQWWAASTAAPAPDGRERAHLRKLHHRITSETDHEHARCLLLFQSDSISSRS